MANSRRLYLQKRIVYTQGLDDCEEADLDENDLLKDIQWAMLRSFSSEYNPSLWSEFDKRGEFSLPEKEIREIEKKMSLKDQFKLNK